MQSLLVVPVNRRLPRQAHPVPRAPANLVLRQVHLLRAPANLDPLQVLRALVVRFLVLVPVAPVNLVLLQVLRAPAVRFLLGRSSGAAGPAAAAWALGSGRVGRPDV